MQSEGFCREPNVFGFFLFSDEMLNCWMHQYVMSLSLFALLLKGVVKLQTQISIQIWKFFLYSTDQSFIRTPSCTSHKFIPSFDANTTTICFVIHRLKSLFFHFPHLRFLSFEDLFFVPTRIAKRDLRTSNRDRNLSKVNLCWYSNAILDYISLL